MRVSFIVLWFISIVALVAVSHQIKENLISSHLEKQVEVLEKEYNATVDHFEQTAQMVYERYGRRPEVVDLMWMAKSADEELKTHLRQEIYDFLKKPYQEFIHIGVKQFHFHFPDAVSFLRMHRPSKYGDDLSEIRYSLIKTNETKKRTVGFEEGRIFNGFRYVYPLYFNEIYIGTVEIGLSSMGIITILNNLFEGHHSFYIDKAVVMTKLFDDEMPNYKPAFLDGLLIESSSQILMKKNEKLTLENINNINLQIKPELEKSIAEYKPISAYTMIGKNTYLATFSPIRNVKGNSVAYISKYVIDERIPEILFNYKILLIAGLLVCSLGWGLIDMLVRYWKQRNTIRTLLFDQVTESDEKLKIQEKMIIQQSKMATIGEMLGAIAHQWKQPLNRLGLTIQSLGFEIPDKCKEGWDVEGYIKNGMKEVMFMGDTVNDFMRFIRPSEGQAICIIRNQIDDVVALVKSSVEKYYIDLNFEINDSMDDQITAMCHGNNFNHILMNLIINARDAILDKKEQNPSDVFKGQIIVTLTNKLDCVWVSVSDNGSGIPPEVEANIFEAHFTTKKKKEGSGLGLYVIKTIIEEAKGSIAVVNNIDGGATFTITLPK